MIEQKLPWPEPVFAVVDPRYDYCADKPIKKGPFIKFVARQRISRRVKLAICVQVPRDSFHEIVTAATLIRRLFASAGCTRFMVGEGEMPRVVDFKTIKADPLFWCNDGKVM